MKLVALAALVLSCLLASVSAFVRMPTVRCFWLGWSVGCLRHPFDHRSITGRSVDPGGTTYTHTAHDTRPPSIHTQPAAPRSSSSSVRPLAAEGPNFFEWGSRFLNELLPWGDSSKGLWAGKRDAMVQK